MKQPTTSVAGVPEFPPCDALMCSSKSEMEKPICPQ